MKKKSAKKASSKTAPQLTPRHDLLYQTLETEMGGVDIYTTAVTCADNDELREEWQKYLSQTKTHLEVIRDACTKLGLDPDRDTPGRQIVRTIGKSLVKAMQLARGAGNPKAAEIVAAECVTLAETKDHSNWSLIGKWLEHASGKEKQVLQAAYDRVEDEEDEHIYHTTGWCRELWLDALDLPAQLPPPEEEADVQSEEEAVAVKKKSASRRK
ncbi:MAG: hypothetical protein SGI72_09890 [Planctomycetota bacterium]|nr:hypothetical protein [Planctomycetota bacterium]